MTTTAAAGPFDPVKYKETTREQWQTAAQARNDWGPICLPRGGRPLHARSEENLAMHIITGAAAAVAITAALAYPALAQSSDLQASYRGAVTNDPEKDTFAYPPPAQGPAMASTLELEPARYIGAETGDSEKDTFAHPVKALISTTDQSADQAQGSYPDRGTEKAASCIEKRPWVIGRRADLPPPMPGQPGASSLGGPGVLEEAFRSVSCP